VDVSFVPVVREHSDAVKRFLLAEPWPFHVGAALTPEAIDERIGAGWLDGPGRQTFWIVSASTRCGLLRLFDLGDGAPLFDLRVSGSARNRGIGAAAVRWLASYVFDGWPDVNRIEATTRVDNVAMRRILERCGWAKESHWREVWSSPEGDRDGVGYALLRRDHQRGSVTPVRWDE